MRLRGRLARSRVLVALMAAHVILKLALWPRVHRAPLSGDEGAYHEAALALRDLVRNLVALHSPDIAELKANVVSNGWFMPGSPIVLTPLYLVVPDPSTAVVRGYIGVLTTLLLLGLAWRVRRRLGYVYACALMVVPGLVPMWVAFSYTIWGDLAAGLVVLAILLVLHRLLGRICVGEPVRMREGAQLGLLAIACLYLRSSALPIAAGVLVLVGLAALVIGRGSGRWRGVAATGAACAVFVVALAPWSVLASKTLGSTVTTTTSTRLSLAITFGDHDRLCFGPCAPPRGSDTMLWFDAVRYSREVASITGEPELEVQRQMSSYALQGVTAHDYAHGVLADFHRYLLEPTEFASRLTPPGDHDPRPFWLIGPSVLLLALGGIAAALTMLDLRRLTFDDRLRRTLLRLLLLASMLQPFVHVSTGRYWPLFTPLLGLAAAHLAVTARRTPSGDRRTDDGATSTAIRAVLVTDAAATAVAVITTAMLVVVGR